MTQPTHPYNAQSWGMPAAFAQNQQVQNQQAPSHQLSSHQVRPSYGQPAYGQQPSYQQAPYQPPRYGQPAYGYAAAPAQSSGVLPWLMTGLVALLVAGGIGLVFLLQSDSPGVVADTVTQSDPGGEDPIADPDSDPGTVPSPPTDCLVECTDDSDPTSGDTPDTEEANYSGSADAALAFVQAIVDGDLSGAHASLCGAGMDMFATPEELVADFYATFGFTMINGGSSTDVYAADATHDAVVFELDTDAGQVEIEVYILEEGSALTICGYSTP